MPLCPILSIGNDTIVRKRVRESENDSRPLLCWRVSVRAWNRIIISSYWKTVLTTSTTIIIIIIVIREEKRRIFILESACWKCMRKPNTNKSRRVGWKIASNCQWTKEAIPTRQRIDYYHVVVYRFVLDMSITYWLVENQSVWRDVEVGEAWNDKTPASLLGVHRRPPT